MAVLVLLQPCSIKFRSERAGQQEGGSEFPSGQPLNFVSFIAAFAPLVLLAAFAQAHFRCGGFLQSLLPHLQTNGQWPRSSWR